MRAYHKVVAAYLGKRMKEKRDNLGYTQEKMAERLGVTSRMYGNYERGKSACYVDIFFVFAAMLSTEEWLALHDRVREGFRCQEEEGAGVREGRDRQDSAKL